MGTKNSRVESLGEQRPLAHSFNSQRVAWLCMAGVVGLACLLRLVDLERADLANLFYASAIRSMGLSWHHFFFAAYDPAATITVDKPPLALWLQVLSTKVFGFNGPAMILPVALAGIGGVVGVFYLVARYHSLAAGVVAALVLAVYPESVATSRDTTMDAVLMLVLVFAVMMLIDAVESRRPWRLVAFAAILGIAFNVKFFQAFIVLPAAGIYVAWRYRHAWRELIQPVIVAAVVGIVVAMSWVMIVDLTPEQDRPLIMNDQSNSAVGLALRYNGLERIVSPESKIVSASVGGSGMQRSQSTSGRFGIGNSGPLRLITPVNGALLGFGACLALGGLAILAIRNSPWIVSGPGLFWGLWLLTGVSLFTMSHRAPAHYTESYVLAVAALSGVGVVEAWRATGPVAQWRWLRGVSSHLLLPLLCAVLLCYAVIIYDNLAPLSLPVLTVAAVGLFACAVAMVNVRHLSMNRLARGVSVGAVVGVMLITSLWVAFEAPRTGQITNPNPITYLTKPSLATKKYRSVPSAIVLAHYQDVLPAAKYRLAITGINNAGEVIADTGASVLPVWNNYQNTEVLPERELRRLIRTNQIPVVLDDTWIQDSPSLTGIRAVLAELCTRVEVPGVKGWSTWECVQSN